MAATPFEAARDGVRVAVRVTPKASKNRIQGLVQDADGRVRIKVAVTDPPEDGRANEAVTRLLAKAWGVPPMRSLKLPWRSNFRMKPSAPSLLVAQGARGPVPAASAPPSSGGLPP